MKEKFENYFIVKKNIIFERAKFNSRSQRVGESADSFITDLYGLARYCNFGVLKEELIHYRIVMGLQNHELSEKLQLHLNLTLEKTTTLARQREMAKQQQNILDGGFKSTPAHIDGIVKGKSRRNKGNFKEKLQDKTKEKRSDNSKERTPDQKCQRCLGKLQPSPSVTSVQKSVIGRRLVKVQNQEEYLKLLKRKNRSF